MCEEFEPFARHRSRRRRLLCAALITVAALALAGCAAGNVEHFSADSPADFWAGLWHGFILLFSFIISLFTDAVRVYESVNAGWAYDLGFLLGVIIFWRGNSLVVRPFRWKKEEERR